MTWVQYEVWAVDAAEHEELVDTTFSIKEAKQLAEKALQEGAVECIIYKDEDGELEQFEVIAKE
jgi:hypothetical protein